MSENDQLPHGWRQTTVDESIRIIDYRGRTPPFDGTVIPHLRSQNVKAGRIVWEDLAYVSEGTYAAFMTRGIPKTGDILFTTEAPLGEVALVPDHKFSVAQRIMVLRPSPEVWLPLFLMYQLMSPEVQARIRRKGTGSTVTGVASRNFKPLALRVAPLPEQRRIVAEVEKQFTRLEAGVAALRRTQANLKRYRAAVLNSACKGRLFPTEAQWKQITLGEVLIRIEAGRSFKCEERPPNTDETGVVKVNAVTWGTYDETKSKTCLDPSRMDERFFVCPNDFLFSRANTIELIGACVIAKKVTLRVMLSDKILRFHFSSQANPSWILYWLRSGFGRKEIERLATGNQNSMRNIGQDRIRQISIKLPSLAEQERIVAEVERRLSVVDELESVVTVNLQRANRLRQSILRRAFTGELVAQSLVLPTSLIELPKAKHNQSPNTHFARALLSAEIVHRLHREPTFGRIKHQKIFHLCEHIAQIEEIHGQYHREAAGPLDNKLIYANEAELKKQKWYQEVKRESFGHAYDPMSNAGKHRKYVEDCWPDKMPLIERLIELMRGWNTDRCEIFCTTYAAWNDLILLGNEPTEVAILREILERWHESKKRFPEERWRKAISWMRKNGFVPTGFGKPTKVTERK